jgi:predicted DsbA family dithiol-disulfide isomerase
MNPSLQVVIDVIRPWCFIGKRRLDRILSAAPTAERPVESIHEFINGEGKWQQAQER